jgi:hypothetical protein
MKTTERHMYAIIALTYATKLTSTISEESKKNSREYAYLVHCDLFLKSIHKTTIKTRRLIMKRNR